MKKTATVIIKELLPCSIIIKEILHNDLPIFWGYPKIYTFHDSGGKEYTQFLGQTCSNDTIFF